MDNLRTWLAFGMLLPAEMKNAVGSGAFLKGYSIVRTAECSPMGFVFPDNREFKPCTDKLQIKGM